MRVNRTHAHFSKIYRVNTGFRVGETGCPSWPPTGALLRHYRKIINREIMLKAPPSRSEIVLVNMKNGFFLFLFFLFLFYFSVTFRHDTHCPSSLVGMPIGGGGVGAVLLLLQLRATCSCPPGCTRLHYTSGHSKSHGGRRRRRRDATAFLYGNLRTIQFFLPPHPCLTSSYLWDFTKLCHGVGMTHSRRINFFSSAPSIVY